MIPENERWEGIELLGYWALLLGLIAAVLFAAAGVVELGKRILAVLWPWMQAHSNQLIVGLFIGISIATVVALCVEEKKR